MEGPSTFSRFSLCGDPARAKLLVLGPIEPALSGLLCSLNIEHVSPTHLVQSEISRHSPLGRQAARALQRGIALAEETILALLRRWFWTRKPDAGFVLSDFPATLLQAMVFDEWLEARGEQLTGAFISSSLQRPGAVVEHYRLLGLDLIEPAAPSI